MYFITMIDRASLMHCSRCFGWFKKLKDAQATVINNEDDLHETIYEYAVIEFIPEGSQVMAKEIQWYDFNHKTMKYDKIKKPLGLKSICNFAIG